MKSPAFALAHSAGDRRKTTTAFMAAMWLSFASVATCEAPKLATDEQINYAVDYKLLTDAALVNSQVFGKTTAGIVTLAGTVNSLLAKERAVKIAQTLRGVRGVVNTIKLEMPSVPDAELQKNVVSALRFDAATAPFEIEPAVKDGVVTLSGTLHHYCEIQLAEFVVKGVKGVRELKNNLTVEAKNDRTDAEILAELNHILDNDVWLEPNFINVAVKDGVVTLRGAVGSAAQFDRASMVVLDAGVKAVNADNLQIEPWARSSGQRGDTVVLRSDEQILQAVQDSFKNDPRVYARNPRVTVTHAMVTLTGEVDNLKALRSAGQDAMNTPGVWRVKNLLKVRPATPMADDSVSQSVTSALKQSTILDGDEIKADARRGVVVLSGTVNTYFEKSEAEDIASRASGVLNVKNLLIVTSPAVVYYDTNFSRHWEHPPFYLNRLPDGQSGPYPGDREVKYDIENALYWSPWVERNDIAVKVENGTVTLTGKAASWWASHKATEIAYENGALQVFNNLTVK
jgi:osmotically-inducible protein OsmY